MADQRSVPKFELRVNARQVRNHLLTESQVNRFIEPQRCLNRLAGFKVISRRYDRNIMNCSQCSKIVKGVVSAAECSVTNSGTDSDDLNRAIRIANIVFYLLQSSRGQKASWRNREHLFSGRRQTGRNPNQVLFGDSDLDDLLWYRGREGSQPAGSARVARNYQYVPIRFRRLHQRRREHIKI